MATELLAILVLILLNGLFSAAEIALIALRRTRLDELAGEGSKSAAAVLALRAQPEQLFATVQIGITLVGSAAAVLGGMNLSAPAAAVLESWGVPPRLAQGAAVGIVIGTISFLSIVLGELVPKSLGLRHAEAYGLMVGRPLAALATLMRPAVWLLTGASNLILVPLGDTTTFSEARLSAEELQQLVEDAAKTGAVHPEAGEIASRAIDFAGLTAAAVMVPRKDVVSLVLGAPPQDNKRTIVERTHTRLPVCDGKLDNVVGYVSVNDLLPRAFRDEPFDLRACLRPPYFVPGSKPAIDLLRDMRGRRSPLAIVLDEQGELAGIVTLEDLVEELVGEIFSEHAREVSSPITRGADGSCLVRADFPIRELNRLGQLDLPEATAAGTVAGLVLAELGRVPAPGDALALPDGTRIEIVDASLRRIRMVRIHPPSVATARPVDTDG